MYYTIGTSILSASTMPLGLIMGRGKNILSVFASVRAVSALSMSDEHFYPNKTNTDAE